MDKDQLLEFVQWLPTKVKAFERKTSEEIVEILNNMSKTAEGQKQIEGLITAFKQESAAITPEKESEMFRKGGKIDYLVEKFQQGNKFNRSQARSNKEAAGLYEYDENTGARYRVPIDKGNLTAKVAKARAVEGYEDRDFVTEFDRGDYRRRKRELRQSRPELSLRESKAEALLESRPNIVFERIDVPMLEYQPRGRGKGVVEVGEVNPTSVNPTSIESGATRHNIYRTSYNYKPMSWDQFGTYALNHLKNSGAYRGNVDLNTIQAYLENEYDRYRREGLDYRWRNPGSGDMLKVDGNWRSRYGTINSNANNWGNVDRSGTIDFSGQRSVGDIVDPKGEIRNAEIITTDYNFDPEERARRRFESRTPTNQYRDNVDMSRSFSNSDVSDALYGTAVELGGKPVAATIGGYLAGRAAGSAVQGFGQNFLNGTYTQAAHDILGQNMLNNWLTQSRIYRYYIGGAGGGSRYLPTGRLGHTSPYNRMMNWMNWHGVSDAGRALPTRTVINGGARTLPLFERIVNVSPNNFGLAGAAIAGGAQGARGIYNMVTGDSYMDRLRRENYTSFNPEYSSEE